MSGRPTKVRKRNDTWYSAGGGLGRRGKTTWGFWDSGAKRYVKAGTTKAEATVAQAEYRSRRGRGEKPIVPVKITIAELLEQWFESKTRLGARTARGYRDSLDLVHIPRFGDWQVGALDADALAKLIRDLEREGLRSLDATRPFRPLSSSAINNHLKPLAQALDLAVRRRLISVNPYRTLVADERPQKADPKAAFEWSDEQVASLLVAATTLAQRKVANHDYTPLLRTAVNCGLRLGELTGLCWRHVDLDNAVLNVEQQHTLIGTIESPKTKAGIRRVPLTAEMAAFFRTLKLASRFSQPEHFVFSSDNGTPLQHSNVRRRGFEPARDLAGLPEELRFHDLRHAFASMAAAKGVPINVLSAALGHADIGVTTKVYLHLYAREAAEDAFRKAMGS